MYFKDYFLIHKTPLLAGLSLKVIFQLIIPEKSSTSKGYYFAYLVWIAIMNVVTYISIYYISCGALAERDV